MMPAEKLMDFATIESSDFCDLLEKAGYDFFTGVPCSVFNPLYRELKNRSHLKYISAVREDSAVGIAAGAYFAGRQPVVVMQNSGLGYSLNAFTSLALIYEIPLLVLMSWRGYQGKDAPEHVVMGATMLDVLRDVGIPYLILGESDISQELGRVRELVRQARKPVFVVVRNGVLR